MGGTRQKFYKLQEFAPEMVAIINRNFEMIFGGQLSGNTLRKGTVTSEHILDRTIVGADIALDTIQGENIKDGTIELADLSSTVQSSINGSLSKTLIKSGTATFGLVTSVDVEIESDLSASDAKSRLYIAGYYADSIIKVFHYFGTRLSGNHDTFIRFFTDSSFTGDVVYEIYKIE